MDTYDVEPDWDSVWFNVFSSSKNPALQLIHLKLIHKDDVTPYKRYQMKLTPPPNCSKCNTDKGIATHRYPISTQHISPQ